MPVLVPTPRRNKLQRLQTIANGGAGVSAGLVTDNERVMTGEYDDGEYISMEPGIMTDIQSTVVPVEIPDGKVDSREASDEDDGGKFNI